MNTAIEPHLDFSRMSGVGDVGHGIGIKQVRGHRSKIYRHRGSACKAGLGISGYVFLSPDLRSAKGASLRGRLCHGSANDPELRAIEMDVVSSPYLLDFAGVQFSKPDFSADVMAHWHQKISEFFSPNEALIYGIYAALARHGIFYMDFRPSNLNLNGHPDAKLS